MWQRSGSARQKAGGLANSSHHRPPTGPISKAESLAGGATFGGKRTQCLRPDGVPRVSMHRSGAGGHPSTRATNAPTPRPPWAMHVGEKRSRPCMWANTVAPC